MSCSYAMFVCFTLSGASSPCAPADCGWLLQARGNIFQRGVKVKMKFYRVTFYVGFHPYPLKSCWLLMQHKGGRDQDRLSDTSAICSAIWPGLPEPLQLIAADRLKSIIPFRRSSMFLTFDQWRRQLFWVWRPKGGSRHFYGGKSYMVANNALPQYGAHTPWFQVPLPFPWSLFSFCFLWFLSFPPLFFILISRPLLLWYS